jgi:hypothetical protein
VAAAPAQSAWANSQATSALLQPQLQMPQYAQLRGELNLPHAIRALENFIISVPPGRAEKEDQPMALVQFLFSAHDGITQKLQQATVGGNWSTEVDELVMLNSRISQVSVIGRPAARLGPAHLPVRSSVPLSARCRKTPSLGSASE